ncbi:MAG: prephenate dehydrogenase/arogenate dehydrogenase family protein, partial [Muribaculaceae bacterium]|nr:prephenate dehydrogenase/arogenate dehydrogenase family protein [Muribaculaceae bacterium]
LNIVDYTFEEHDVTTAYSLSLPFASTLVFAGVMKHQEAPGTTFKRHMAIARGLLSEDDYLLQEILFNPNSSERLTAVRERLAELQEIVDSRDADRMKDFLNSARRNIE